MPSMETQPARCTIGSSRPSSFLMWVVRHVANSCAPLSVLSSRHESLGPLSSSGGIDVQAFPPAHMARNSGRGLGHMLDTHGQSKVPRIHSLR